MNVVINGLIQGGSGVKITDSIAGNTITALISGTYRMNTLEFGTSYQLSVTEQPPGQICSPASTSGSVGANDVNLILTCVPRKSNKMFFLLFFKGTYKFRVTLSCFGVPKSKPILMQKIATKFTWTFLPVFIIFIELSGSHAFKDPQMNLERPQIWGGGGGKSNCFAKIIKINVCFLWQFYWLILSFGSKVYKDGSPGLDHFDWGKFSRVAVE